ncbi:unnamed protein product [Coregonus sp. 'balchen']|nr:unnamed protein product [Coregonus sp. 'balchen']
MPQVFSKALYKAKVLETAPIDTTILRLDATYLDEEQWEITVARPLDYEETSVYEIRVEAQDRGHLPLASPHIAKCW